MKRFALCLLALCAALVPIGGLAVPGWAETTKYYVNNDSGNDGNTGSSAVDAFKTITYALVQAQENDTIFVAATSTPYTEGTLTITKTITLESNGATLDGQEKRRVIKITGGKVTIQNLTITGGKTKVDYSQYSGHELRGKIYLPHRLINKIDRRIETLSHQVKACH